MPQKQDNVFQVQILYAGMRKICDFVKVLLVLRDHKRFRACQIFFTRLLLWHVYMYCAGTQAAPRKTVAAA
jgi:hypothetical protein